MSERPLVWVNDDDEAIRFVLERALSRAEYRVSTFSTVGELNEALTKGSPDVILTDIRLPDADGLTVLDALRAEQREIPVIAMTGFSDLDQAVTAFQKGVFDYLPKPFDLDQVLSTVASAVVHRPASTRPAPKEPDSRMIGDSPAMQEVFRTIGRLSRSNISVLITGETGSGKEVVARALHEHSPRSGGPFVAINTAAIPSELLESELFGHERGSFTGAHSRRHGRFEEAAGGTLFLDEIGDMPLTLQTRLLRVLAEGDYYRVGGRDLLKADVRVIAATHQNLDAHISDGSFREDLYHRLNVITISMPPLRERTSDIPALAEHFLEQAAIEMGLEVKTLRPETISLLKSQPWPGNVRQLQNVCQQLCVMAPGEQVFPEDLPAELSVAGPSQGRDDDPWQEHLRAWVREALPTGQQDLMVTVRDDMEQVLFEEALDYTGGKRVDAARVLGVGRNTLTRKLKDRDDED
ncbi:nitrogen regulation protein NR(I) [Marinihelvus fidelis]|uniref:DNA-binding transcriptional regulator NtrC n=1 Tax=Marinihelvus fidelis TaxID=2613842 RepID=A0A5N0T8H5_9GAMM|nr:nitrogen regulation protein NR(I) [Marinihelvus fidelis]KAA9131333.1 nitrogen regulation protein NR(I) [Marinihelvus fidelis]